MKNCINKSKILKDKEVIARGLASKSSYACAYLAKCPKMCYNILMNILRYFIGLYRKNRQLVLLSWVYGILAVVFVFIAGIFALINQSVGVAILIVPLIAICALSANVVAWALIHLMLDSTAKKLEAAEKAKDSRKKSK